MSVLPGQVKGGALLNVAVTPAARAKMGTKVFMVFKLLLLRIDAEQETIDD